MSSASDYDVKDDRRFGVRFLLLALVSSIPIWIGLTIAGFYIGSLTACLIVLVVTLPFSLAVIAMKTRYAICPKCDQKILVNWKTDQYKKGGMLHYQCDQCRIIWRMFLYPGSDL